jgi:hypothetical protein
MIQELARYWAADYDWRECEAKLNALPQFMTEIDGLGIHFIHVRSDHDDATRLRQHVGDAPADAVRAGGFTRRPSGLASGPR